jgi:hypothetical protein
LVGLPAFAVLGEVIVIAAGVIVARARGAAGPSAMGSTTPLHMPRLGVHPRDA